MSDALLALTMRLGLEGGATNLAAPPFNPSVSYCDELIVRYSESSMVLRSLLLSPKEQIVLLKPTDLGRISI